MPGVAAIVGAINPALVGFDDSPNAIWICAGDGDADTAENAFGQPVAFEFFPGCAAIDGAVETATWAAAIETPGSAPSLPQGGEKNVRVGGIEDDVDAPGLSVSVKNFLPALATILGAEDSALFIIAEGMSESGDESDVRILRIDGEAADRVGVGKAGELPGLAGVDGFVNSVATDDVATDASFTGADVNHVGIRFRNCDGADRGRCIFLFVEDRLPVEASVRGFPNSSGGCAEVIDVVLSYDSGDGDDAAAAKWTNQPILQIFPWAFVFAFISVFIFLRILCIRCGRGFLLRRLVLRRVDVQLGLMFLCQ